MLRRLTIGLAILIVLLIGGLIVVTEVVLSPERLKNLAQPYLSEQLGREVTFGRVELSLFSGVRIDSLRIMDDPAFSKKEFLEVREIDVRFSPWGLLTGSVRKVTLSGPIIRVIKDKNDRFNFHGLMKGLAELAARFRYRVSSAEIGRGRVILLDRKSGQKVELTEIGLKGTGISLKEPFPFSLNLRANKTEMNLISRAPAGGQTGQIKLLLKPFDLKPLSFFLPSGLGLRPLGGRLSSQVVLEGSTFDQMRLTGRVVIDKLSLQTNQGVRKGLLAQAEVDLNYSFRKLTAQIRTLDLKVGPNQVQLSGRLGEKTMDLDLKLPNQPWAEAIGLFLGSSKKPPPGTLSGQIKALTGKDGKTVDIQGGFTLGGVKGAGSKAKPLDHQGSLVAEYNPGSGSYTLKSLEVRGPALEFTAQGFFQSDRFNLEVPAFKSDLANLSRLLPPPPGVSLSGSLKGSLGLKGDPGDMSKTATLAQLELTKLGLRSPDLPGPLKASGRVVLKGQDMTGLAIKGKILDTNFKISGKGSGLPAKPNLRIDVTADKASLTKLLGPTIKGALGLDKKKGGKMKVSKNIIAQGRVKVRKLKLGLIPMKNFGTDYLLKNSVLIFKPIDQSKWRGTTLNSEVSLDLGG